MEFTDKEIHLSWSDIDELVENICHKIKATVEENALGRHEIIAITNGGIIPATIISYSLGIKNINLFPIIDKKIIHSKIPKFEVGKKYLLVDEIYDTGRTFREASACLGHIDRLNVFLIERYETAGNGNGNTNRIIGKTLQDSRWVVFPWENQNRNPA